MGQRNCIQNWLALIYTLQLTEKELRIKDKIGWALNKCLAVRPLISGAFPLFKPDMALPTSSVPKIKLHAKGNPK